MYESCINYERTEAERADPKLAWRRSDRAFFASGACHILAYKLVELYPKKNYQIVFIKPAAEFGSIGTHLYVRDGNRAFDFNGWNEEAELLEVDTKAYQEAHPGWSPTLEVIDQDIETFCDTNNHQLPQDFAHDPWPRAEKYIKQIETS